jgi:hypothetical protein
MLTITSVCYANPLILLAGSPPAASGGSQPTALLYINANSATNGQTPATYGKGTGNLSVGAAVSSITGVVGNALLQNGNIFNVQTTGNITPTLFTASFYMRPNHAVGWYFSNDGFNSGTTALLAVQNVDGNAAHYTFTYMNSSYASYWPAITDNHWIWISVTGDSANGRAAYRLYDQTSSTWLTSSGTSAWVDMTGLSGAVTSDGDIIFSDYNRDMNTAFDQIVITGGFKDDVFSSRDLTSGW